VQFAASNPTFIDIGGVSGLLHISEISDHIDTPHSVFNVNDEVKVMIIGCERGRISFHKTVGAGTGRHD